MLVKLKDKNKYILGLKNNEFELFLSKFYGTLTSRGRKSFAIKLFNKILLNFKNCLNCVSNTHYCFKTLIKF